MTEPSDAQLAEKILRSRIAFICMAAIAGDDGDLKTLVDDLVQWFAAQRIAARGEISEAQLDEAWHVYTHTNPGKWDREHMRAALEAASLAKRETA